MLFYILFLYFVFQINLLQKDNLLIVEVPNLNVDSMTTSEARNLLSTIETKSGLVAGLEKLTPRLYLGENGTLESDPKGTNVWLYLLDPSSGEILTRESEPVKRLVIPTFSLPYLSFSYGLF